MPDEAHQEDSDESLLWRYAKERDAKNPAAERTFDTLYRRYRDRLRGFVQYHLLHSRPHISQDFEVICANAWIEIEKGAAKFRGDNNATFWTWACKIALRRLFKHAAKQRKWWQRQAPTDEEDRQPIIDDAPSRTAAAPAQLLQSELEREIEAAILALEPDLRTVFVLKAKEDLTYDEIHELTGVLPRTLQDRYRRAVEKLEFLLRKHGPENATGATHDA